jgi:hypothetical protein
MFSALTRKNRYVLVNDALAVATHERRHQRVPDAEAIGQVGVHQRFAIIDRHCLRGDDEHPGADFIDHAGDVRHMKTVAVANLMTPRIEEPAIATEIVALVAIADLHRTVCSPDRRRQPLATR